MARNRRSVGESDETQAALAAHPHGHCGHRLEQHARIGSEDSFLRRSRPALQSSDVHGRAPGQGGQDHLGRHGAYQRRLSVLQEVVRERGRARQDHLLRQHHRTASRGTPPGSRHGAYRRRVFRGGQEREGIGAAYRHDALRRCLEHRQQPYGSDSVQGQHARFALFRLGQDL